MTDTLPAEAIEAAAEALYTADYRNGEPFAKYPVGSYWGDRYRSEARAALLAALPHLARLAAVHSEQEPVAYLIEDSPVRGIRAIVWPGELQRAMEEEPQAKTTPLYAHPSEQEPVAWRSWPVPPASARPANADLVERLCSSVQALIAALPPNLAEGLFLQAEATAEQCRRTLAVLASSPAGVPNGWKLTAYEAQVLIGTCISGCSMPPDRVFDLPAAWSSLFDKGLIDRVDGLAIATPKGQCVIDAMLSASPSPPALDGAGRDAVLEEIAKWLEEQAEADITMAEDTPEYSSDGYRLMLRRKWRKADATAIRALKETP